LVQALGEMNYLHSLLPCLSNENAQEKPFIAVLGAG